MRSFFAFLALLTWGQANAAQIYLLFEPDCGELIRYGRTVDDVSQMDYYAYSLPAGFGVRMLLETDAAGATVRKRLPEEALSCGSFTVTEEQAGRVNDGVDQLFLLYAMPEGGFRQQPVLMAAVLEEMNGSVRYRSPFASFSFEPENSVIGVDLTTEDESSRVYFEGQQGRDCLASYLLRQENSGTAYPSIDYRIVPGLGVVERNLAGDGRFSDGETIVAKEVNGKPLEEYLEGNCDRAEPRTTFVPLYIEPIPPTTASPSIAAGETAEVKTGEPETYTTVAAPAAPARTIHTVAPGETLYAISRRYGVSVPEIKQANGLVDNTIRVGQELTIGSDATYASTTPYAPPVAEPPVSRPVVPPAAVPAEEPGLVVPPPAPAPEETYSTVPAPDPVAVTPPSVPTETTAEYHVVKPGETLASLARRYGYTTERFKEFNNLRDAQVALVGQRLRTSHCTCPPAAQQTPVPVETAYDAPSYTETYPTSRPVVAPSPYRPLEEETVETETNTGPATPPAYGAPLQQERAFHTVKDGESLYGIARQYRMTVAELQELNELRPADVIVPFQKLYVN